MSRVFNETCTLLVDELVGSLASTVFSILAANGSLPLPQIVQLSKINPRHVKNALALLLQRQLVTHDTASTQTDRTHYQANTGNAYRLIRAGKYAHLADTYLGKDAAGVVQQTQEHGFVAASELAAGLRDKIRADGQTAKVDDGDTTAVAPLEDLFHSNYLVLARARDLISTSALKDEVEADIQSHDFPNGMHGREAKKSFERSVRSQLKRKRDNNQASLDQIMSVVDSHHPRKKLALGSLRQSHANEPVKVNGDVSHLSDVQINGHTNRKINSKGNLEPHVEHDVAPAATTESRTNPKRRKPDKAVDIDDSPNAFSDSRRKRTSAEHKENDVLPTALQRSKRRKLNQPLEPQEQQNIPNGSNEESGLTNGRAAEYEEGSDEQIAHVDLNTDSTGNLDDQNFFRLSLEKFDVSMRSQLLIDFCFQCLGEPTSKVYAALLRCSETTIRRCYDDLDYGNDGSVQDMAHDDDDDAGEETDKVHYDAGLGIPATVIASTIDPKVELYVDDVHPKDSNHAENRPRDRVAEVEHHLRILEEHENAFAHPIKVNGEDYWRVDFPRLTTLMMQREMQNIITTRFDTQSARIARILLTKGKMEEKYLANMSLIKQKDIRAKLAVMQEAGFLDVQEVPRDASRQPSRTIFLWYFDLERCQRIVLNDSYQMMARLLQRMRFERIKARSVLDKASRTDVVGREDELLNEGEKAALRELERKEDKIWVQISRLDDTVALLRDFNCTTSG